MSIYQTKHVLGISVGDIVLNKNYEPYFLVMDFKLRLLGSPKAYTPSEAFRKVNSTYHETLNDIESPPLPRVPNQYEMPYYTPVIKGQLVTPEREPSWAGCFYIYYYENNRKQEVNFGAFRDKEDNMWSITPRLFSKKNEEWKSNLAQCYCYVL